MSFYRSLIAVVAAMGLATCAFADDAATSTTTTTTQQQAPAPAAATDTSAATTATTTTTTSTTTAEKVNVNTASVKDLMKVKGLNGVKAKAIVAYRKKHGDFKSLDDLKEVKGFKKMDEKTMKDLQDQLTLG